MRVHLAGGEQIKFLEMVAATGHKYSLLSYFHLKRKPEAEQRRVIECLNENGFQIIVDSGLFTMMFGSGKGQTYSLPQLVDYTKRYLADMQACGLKNMTVVECDVHKILGMPAVFELRKQFEDSGIPTIYVWHREEGIEGLSKLAAEKAYIALSVPELRILFAAQATRYQAAVFNLLGRLKSELGHTGMPKIHLLGNTIKETMETTLAYSCDSTSYLSAVRYGNAIVFDNGNLDKMHIRSPSFEKLVRQTIDGDAKVRALIDRLTPAEKFRYYLEICFVCALSYYRYQRWLDQRFTWEGRSA